jgi:hypothetical protein
MPNGDTATVALWNFSSDPSTIDTQYVADVDDTMDLYQLFSRQTVFERYIFPLRVGNRWLDMYENDTSFVAGIDSIEVPAGTFTRCFRVDRDWPGYRGNLWLRKWIDPEVGLVKWNEIKYDLGPFGPFAHDSAQLIRYSIAPVN